MSHSTLFDIFFFVWALLGVGGYVYFKKLKDPGKKRERLRIFILFSGALFLLFVGLQTQDPMLVALLAVPVGFISYLNIRLNVVCDQCSAVIYILQPMLYKTRFCPKCGAELKKG